MNKPRKTPPKPGFVDRELRDDYYRQRYFERHELRNEAKDKDDKAAGKEGGAVTLQIPKSLSFIVIGVISVFTFFEWTLRTLVNALMVGTLAMIFAMLWSIWSA